MAKKMEEHRIWTTRAADLAKTLPEGVKGRVDSRDKNILIVRFPEFPHPLNAAYYAWCRENSITNGFSL